MLYDMLFFWTLAKDIFMVELAEKIGVTTVRKRCNLYWLVETEHWMITTS